MHPCFDFTIDMFSDSQQLDTIAEFGGILDIQPADIGDPFSMNILEVDPGAETERNQNGQLVGCIYTLDIKGRIRFGIAEFLRGPEHIGKIGALLGHAGKNVITGAVHDAEDTAEIIGGKVPLDRCQNRNTAADGCFELYLDALPYCGGVDIGTMQRQERLVGGNDMLSLFNGLQHETLGRLIAADQFDDNRDFGVIENIIDAGRQNTWIDAHAPVARYIKIGNALHYNARPDLGADNISVLAQQLDDSRADVAEPYQTNLYIFHYSSLDSSVFSQTSISSSMPFTNAGDSLSPKRRTISIASFMLTFLGISARNISSYAASRMTFRSTRGIRDSDQFLERARMASSMTSR